MPDNNNLTPAQLAVLKKFPELADALRYLDTFTSPHTCYTLNRKDANAIARRFLDMAEEISSIEIALKEYDDNEIGGTTFVNRISQSLARLRKERPCKS